MSIEKCQQFIRFSDVGADDWCKGAIRSVKCGGFSDSCEYPWAFKPWRVVAKEDITFPGNIPSIEELEKRVRKGWNEK